MVGFSSEELMSARPPINYLAPEETERAKAFHEAVAEGRAPREGVEFRFVRKDGSRFDALIYEAPLIDSDGQHTGWMASIVDVTVQETNRRNCSSAAGKTAIYFASDHHGRNGLNPGARTESAARCRHNQL